MAYFGSLREYLKVLGETGQLVTINNPINKDTELSPLYKIQFRGLPEEQRKAFLFTNVFDSRGKKYDMPVAMGVIGSNPDILAFSLQCKPEELQEKIAQMFLHPIEPRLVKTGPAQEIVHTGDKLLEKGGMDQFPVPLSTVGWDAAPTQTASAWVTKDAETGKRNVGCYRSQLYAQDRLGIHVNTGGTTPRSTGLNPKEQNLSIHWQKARAGGIPLQAAIVVGGPPNLNHCSSLFLPYGEDAYGIAGAMAGEPVELVKCKTVDIEVPANADVVIEGTLSTKELMMEAPHGEGFGYMGMEEWMPYFDITCITHRKNPIWFTQPAAMGPIECYTMMAAFGAAGTYKRLRYDLGLKSVLKVAYPTFLSSGNRTTVLVIQLKMGTDQDEVWRVLEGAPAASFVIAVDDDIDPEHPDQFWYAVSSRSLIHRDSRIVRRRYATGSALNSYQQFPVEEMQRIRHHQFDPRFKVPFFEGSGMLLNATLKWPHPPVSLPKKEYMENAIVLWNKLGLTPLQKLQAPWYGHELGYWSKEGTEAAERAVKGEYYKTGEMRFKNRIKIDFPIVEEFKPK